MKVDKMRWMQTFLMRGLNLSISEFQSILHTILEEEIDNLDLWNKVCEIAPLYGWKVRESVKWGELTMVAEKSDLKFLFGADIQGDREFWMEYKNTLYEDNLTDCKKRYLMENDDWGKAEKISVFTFLHEVFNIIKNS